MMKCLIFSDLRMSVDWMLGPPVLIGDRVAYVGADEPMLATVRWLGRLPDIFQHQLVAGISLVRGDFRIKKQMI